MTSSDFSATEHLLSAKLTADPPLPDYDPSAAIILRIARLMLVVLLRDRLGDELDGHIH